MVNIDKFKANEIRKIFELEDSEGNIEKIILKNPTKKVRTEFSDVATKQSEDNFNLIEYLIKELTNIELNKPLKEILEGEYVEPVLEDVVKELSTIVLELVRGYVRASSVNIEMKEAEDTLKEFLKENGIQ
ncbi:hypothetical protein [Peptacetobacter sp. AB800]|uniref:hypothetical protein n=1 Tax=Peptacetobacter sp. AB800 TaxID=3388428 RepID=UPI0039FC3E7F